MSDALVGLILGLCARVWLWTLRLRVFEHPDLEAVSDRPWVLALWHGQLLPLLGHRRRRRTVALVSWSRDGSILSWAMRWFGVCSARGSSSRGGRAGLEVITSRLREDWDAAFAVDGPRGPAGVAQPGALAAAQAVDGRVVPYAAACSRALRLRSWDRFQVPLPFTQVVIVLGEPIAATSGVSVVDCLSDRIDAAAKLAQEVLDQGGVCTHSV